MHPQWLNLNKHFPHSEGVSLKNSKQPGDRGEEGSQMGSLLSAYAYRMMGLCVCVCVSQC